MTRRRTASTVPVAGPVDVTFGAFALSQFRVPYMSAVMRVQEVAEYDAGTSDVPRNGADILRQ